MWGKADDVPTGRGSGVLSADDEIPNKALSVSLPLPVVEDSGVPIEAALIDGENDLAVGVPLTLFWMPRIALSDSLEGWDAVGGVLMEWSCGCGVDGDGAAPIPSILFSRCESLDATEDEITGNAEWSTIGATGIVEVLRLAIFRFMAIHDLSFLQKRKNSTKGASIVSMRFLRSKIGINDCSHADLLDKRCDHVISVEVPDSVCIGRSV